MWSGQNRADDCSRKQRLTREAHRPILTVAGQTTKYEERKENAIDRSGCTSGRPGCSLIPMRDLAKQRQDETDLEHLYSELTGASEACARSVFMFVCSDDAECESDGESPAASN
jgi:hypothetical protein